MFEYDALLSRLGARKDIRMRVLARNGAGAPVRYRIDYLIRSICAVGNLERLGEAEVENPPVFADSFPMEIDIPCDYPCIDAQPVYRFLTVSEDGESIPHPWHPNIRWFGAFAGRVCVNAPDSYSGIVWCVERIAGYLKYDIYHALNEPPYPEDQHVAAWVVRQGEPRGWVYFNEK